MSPKVSVVIPTFNRAHYVVETINSVLAQTLKDLEVIVVDDGSTDNTREAVEKFGDPVKYVYQNNGGVASASNAGFRSSTGEYVGLLGDDDLWLSNKLEVQVKELDRNPQLGFVCSQADVFNDDGILYTLKRYDNKDTYEDLFNNNFVPTLTVLMRRSCVEQIGFLDETIASAEDYDYWLRLARRWPFKFIDQTLAKWRMTPNSVSKNLNKMFLGHWQMFHKKEIYQGVPFFKRMIRLSRLCLEYAELYEQRKEFSKAAHMYGKGLLMFPFIGGCLWPKETQTMRFSLPYRIWKIYGSMFKNLWLSSQPKLKEVHQS